MKDLLLPALRAIPHQRNVRLSDFLTIGTGGCAALGFFPEEEEQLLALLKELKKNKIRFYVLGGGSNVLPPEGNFEGAVLFTGRLRAIRQEGTFLHASCGVPFSSLFRYGRERGISCAPFMAGIPARVGGGVYMNAGIGEERLSSVIESVRASDGTTIRTFTNADCAFSYKDSAFRHNGFTVLSAKLRGIEKPREQIDGERKAYLERRAALPKGKSMGCVFKNPAGVAAGALIEGCGLKGRQIGGAYISGRHANFILNGGGATVSDIKELIRLAKSEVQNKYGVLLQEEIQYME